MGNQMVSPVIFMKAELKCQRFITSKEKKMVLRFIGTQAERNGMNEVTSLGKKMVLGLNGILTKR